MSITLFGLKPKDTYQALIKVGNNTNLDGTNKILSDGLGNDLPMQVSTTEVNFTGLVKQGGITLATTSQLSSKQDTLVSGTNIKSINGSSILGSGNLVISTSSVWGAITGTLSAQTDLQTALDSKVDENIAILGATKTKVTYDAKGLVTSGADATTSDIADSLNKRYVLDAQLVVLGNTSGTNTGDNATNTQYSGLAASKQDTLVSGTNIKTINSTSILGTGDLVVSASPSGVAGAIQFSDGSVFSSDAGNLFYDDTNNRLGVGTNVPNAQLSVKSSGGDIVRIMSSDGSKNTFFTNSGLFGVQVYPSAAIHSAGSGTTSATSSLIVQNSTNSASFKVADDGVNTFTFGSGGKVVIAGNVSGGDVLLDIRRVPSGNAGFLFRSDNSGNQSLATTNGALNLESPNGNITTYAGGTGQNRIQCEIRDMTAFNTGAMLFLGSLGASAARWINFGWNALYGSIFQAVRNGSSPAVDTLCINPFGGNVGIGQTLANASAKLDVFSTTQGFLPPRMTTVEKTAILTPVAGLIVYDSTTNKLQCYNGTIWNDLF